MSDLGSDKRERSATGFQINENLKNLLVLGTQSWHMLRVTKKHYLRVAHNSSLEKVVLQICNVWHCCNTVTRDLQIPALTLLWINSSGMY